MVMSPTAVATQCWAEGVWTGKWSHEQKRSVDEWPHWHTPIFSNDDMTFVCPTDVKKDTGAEGPFSVLEEVGSQARA